MGLKNSCTHYKSFQRRDGLLIVAFIMGALCQFYIMLCSFIFLVNLLQYLTNKKMFLKVFDLLIMIPFSFFIFIFIFIFGKIILFSLDKCIQLQSNKTQQSTLVYIKSVDSEQYLEWFCRAYQFC